MSTASDTKQVILDRVAALEVQRARIEAETASLMLEFADVCRAESERQADAPGLRRLRVNTGGLAQQDRIGGFSTE